MVKIGTGISENSITMKRTKPPFRADHVGSLLRPKRLLEARLKFDGDATGELRSGQGRVSQELSALEDEAIREAVSMQERVGLRSITDGEFRRRSFHQDFLLGLEGVALKYEASALNVSFHNEKGENRGRGAAFYFVDKVRHTKPINVAPFEFLRSVTSQTPKVTIPSPSLVLFFSDREFISRTAYPDLEMFYSDLAACYRKELSALAQAGCTYAQLDDTAFAMICDPRFQDAVRRSGRDPKQLIATYCDVVNDAIRDRPQKLTVAMHICRGNKEGKWMAEGSYDYAAESVFPRLNVDAFFLEYDSPRAGGFPPLKYVPPSKTVVLGLITTKSPQLEPKDFLRKRIDQASKYFPIEQMCVSTQCGFASTIMGNPLSIDEEERKLALIVDVARDTWGEA